jgi:predicted nucleic acid-binding protein
VRYLLDTNVLIAWGWQDHVDHDRAAAWIAAVKRVRSTTLLTSGIPQLGFVRVSVQRAAGRLTVSEAARVLSSMLDALGQNHRFVADNIESIEWPDWCRSASRTTDAHLLSLASANQAELATLDNGIPGAFLLPAHR